MTYKELLLVAICEKLQLQPRLYELAEERYHVIADTIEKATAFNDTELRIYPQGSFRLKTTVKPLKGNEYDLDFVAELPKEAMMTPRQLYDRIYDILSTDGVHNDMVERKTRCIRVNYANDFHIDIMPGKAIDRATSEIVVPDRELDRWYHHSNPIGYAEWFENQARTHIISTIFESRKISASAEPIEEQEITARLEPLRRATQLIKRYRDIYCDRYGAAPVRSIVLCTLMGQITSTYSGELQILNDFCRYVKELAKSAQGKPFRVKNPVVNEILTEKWEEDPDIYKDFITMISTLERDIQILENEISNAGIIAKLKAMFGETVTNDAVKAQAEPISKARAVGSLAVGATGLLNTNKVGATVVKNTFYGE